MKDAFKPGNLILLILCAVSVLFVSAYGCAAAVENVPTISEPSNDNGDSGPGDDPSIRLEGVAYSVDSDSSRAVFQVEEILRFNPGDTIIVELATEEGDSSALSGEVRFDGGSSIITLDVHQLMSTQRNRDRYLRNVLFPDPGGRFAEFEIPSLAPIPDGFTTGEEVTASVDGNIKINGISTPLQFDVVTRHDGDSVFVLGETTFSWEDVGVAKDDVLAAQPVVSIGDEISAQILLKLLP